MSRELFEGFSKLCLEDRLVFGSDADNIGTYNEKRFHRVFKRFVCDDAECYEVKVGRFVADVLCDGHITEIQTKNFSSLKKKVEYYLNETDYTVSVVKPLICEKKIIRADKETGEVKYTRLSPKKEGMADALREIYHLRDFIANERLRIHLVFVKAEEYRYSERVRYRRTGAYENDLFPTEIVSERVLCGLYDYLFLLPKAFMENEFTVSEYSKETGFVGRAAYSALNILYAQGVLDKKYQVKKQIFMYKK
jgi:hypothetical protein